MMEIDVAQWFYGTWTIIGAGIVIYFGVTLLVLTYEGLTIQPPSNTRPTQTGGS